MGKPIRFEARGHVGIPPEALWPFIANTSRLNRAIGLPPIRYLATPVEGGGSRITAEYRVLGLPLARWTEHPFEWEEPARYSALRDYTWGPIERFRGGIDLTPATGGTDVLAFGEFTSRNPLGGLIARFIGPRMVERTVRQCRGFEQAVLGKTSDPFPELAPKGPPSGRLLELGARLRERRVEPALIDQLCRHLAEAPEEEVVKVRPLELADRWGFGRRETLVAFLHATTVGLVVMTWDILCPHCRVGQNACCTLRDLRAEAHCDACNLTFSASFDRLVEARFTVAPAIRKASAAEYCMGGPMNTPHVVAQTAVEPGAVKNWHVQVKPGTYRLRSPRSKGVLTIAVSEEAAESPARVVLGSDHIEPGEMQTGGGRLTLRLENQVGSGAGVILEELTWPDTIATAALVSTVQEFRDLFSSEVLSPGVQLGIEHLAFLFTDLTGSTALYQQIGQARAFRLVQDHFGILAEQIRVNEGALVKTIGDAVMATFPSGVQALRAALAIQHAIRALNTAGKIDPARLVKIGLHQGPCLAVNLNERLDYFGTTVNVASRVEHQAQGGEIVATEAIYGEASVQELLGTREVQSEPFEVQLKGIADPVRAYRIAPAGELVGARR